VNITTRRTRRNPSEDNGPQHHPEEALGLSDRAQGFLSLARAEAAHLADAEAIVLARRLDDAVAAHATVADWAERDDVRRDIRADAMRALLADEKTRALVTPDFLDELMVIATARAQGRA
jgi:hypothetical protein